VTSTAPPLRRGTAPLLAFYGGVLVLTAVSVGLIIALGPAKGADPPGPSASPHGAGPAAALQALAVLAAAAWLGGRAARRLGQPAVVGQLLAGVVVGSGLLDQVASWSGHGLLPADALHQLHPLLVLSLLLLGVSMGTEQLDPDQRDATGRAILPLLLSHVSLLAPLCLGTLAAALIWPLVGTGDRREFCLFVGVALSVTALPVLSRLLADNGLDRSPLGRLALRAALWDDVTAWVLLALLLSWSQAGEGGAVARGLVAMMVLGACALLAPRHRRPRPRWLRLAATAGLTAAVLPLAGYTGMHVVVLAFLIGSVLQAWALAAHELLDKVERVNVRLLLPLLFAAGGAQVQVGELASGTVCLAVAVLAVAAVLGKAGSAYLAARLAGLDRSAAGTIAVLLNTRGLTGLVVVEVGRSAGLVGSAAYTALVAVVLLTCVVTTPVLKRLQLSPAGHVPAQRGSVDVRAARRPQPA
jgi:Kef-type K+ transport system membrane component KefB